MRTRLAVLASLAMLGVALVGLVAFGILGLGRSGGIGASQADLRYLLVAGQMWSVGHSPYDAAAFSAAARAQFGYVAAHFAYPPQISPLALALATTSFAAAKAAMIALNLLCLAAFALLGAALLRRHPAGAAPWASWWALMSIAVVIGNPFAAHVVWMGQTSLLAAACVLGAWFATYRGQWLIGGVLLGLGTLKPQLVVLFVLWLLLDRQWRVLATGAFTAMALSLVPMFEDGLLEPWREWLGALGSYQGDDVTGWDHRHVFGIGGVIHAFGLNPPSLIPLGLLLLVALYRHRARVDAACLPGLLFAISALFVYAHDYDLAACTALAAPLIWHARESRGLQALLAALACVLFFPSRIWEHFGLEALSRTRELALLGLAGFALLSARPAAAARAPGPEPGAIPANR